MDFFCFRLFPLLTSENVLWSAQGFKRSYKGPYPPSEMTTSTFNTLQANYTRLRIGNFLGLATCVGQVSCTLLLGGKWDVLHNVGLNNAFLWIEKIRPNLTNPSLWNPIYLEQKNKQETLEECYKAKGAGGSQMFSFLQKPHKQKRTQNNLTQFPSQWPVPFVSTSN